MDSDLMEPLVYEEEDDDEEEDIPVPVKSGGKRQYGSVEIEELSTRSTKRQRVTSPLKRSKTPLQQHNSNDDEDIFVSSDEDSSEVMPSGSTSHGLKSGRADLSPSPDLIIDEGSDELIDDENENDKTDTTEGKSSSAGDHVATAPTTTSSTIDETIHVRFRRVLKRIPVDIPYIPMTCKDGSRLYLRLKNPESEEEKETELSRPSRSLIKSNENWERVKNEAKIIREKFQQDLAKAVEKEVVIVENNENSGPADCLWVEKYKPKSFIDLLSQEDVNKALLHWLKLWDKSVFGVDYLAKVKATRQKYAKLEALEKEKEEQYPFNKRKEITCSEDYDDGGRPVVKVALLTGDPGLGKTTCAHILARHAGYKVTEVNASDDRSTEIFQKILDDTTQSRSEIFHNGRPNCLIIDEIDGAPLASVNILVELICGNAVEKGKKKTKKVLRRPVICISNDLYANSLKLLRKHAFVIQFPPVSTSRLVDRLGEVSAVEKLYLDPNTLQKLCEKSECDIRSCLSTLQFVKRKGLNSKDALLAHVGTKDKAKGIFTVWSDIFTMPQGKRYQDAQPDPSKPENRFRNILQVVQCFGEYEKLWGGVHENYLNVKYKDSYLQSVIEGLEWSSWFEDIREYVQRTQTYGMYGYLPMYFVMAHFLFARSNLIKIQFPNVQQTAKIPKFQSMVKSQISETSASAARFLDPYMLITDIFPAVLNIIQPSSIRPVPTQIWTPKERDTFKNVVEIMLTYNLCYTQTKHPETAAYVYVLEPDIEEMVKFNLEESTLSKKPFPYSLKQLVAREVEMEKLRRNDTGPEIVKRETFKQPSGTPKSDDPKQKIRNKVNKTPTPTTVVARDFFGRPIAAKADVSPEAEAKRKNTVSIYFRYKEGYSNAVKKNVKMRDLQ